MTKKKIITYGSILALSLVFAVGAPQAYAHWGRGNLTTEERATMQQEMFQEHADLLGISVDEVKNAWANGQNLWELAKAKGITEDALKEKLATKRQAQMKEHLSSLISSGVITQAQADARIKFMEDVHSKALENGKRGSGRGHGDSMRAFGSGMMF